MRIEYRICRHNLGETDDAAADEYVTALNAALVDAYPGADIVVNFNSDFANEGQLFVSEVEYDENGDFTFAIPAIKENIHEIANLVWDRM